MGYKITTGDIKETMNIEGQKLFYFDNVSSVSPRLNKDKEYYISVRLRTKDVPLNFPTQLPLIYENREVSTTVFLDVVTECEGIVYAC